MRRRGPGYEHRVVPWDEVGEDEGTGIVHIAPGCGAEDYQLGKALGLPVVAPLDEDGHYLAGFGWLTGLDAHARRRAGRRGPREKGSFYHLEPYPHRYPHCWRCGTPLLFRVVDEWYISMGEVYDKPREQVTAAGEGAQPALPDHGCRRPDPAGSRASATSASSTGCAPWPTG